MNNTETIASSNTSIDVTLDVYSDYPFLEQDPQYYSYRYRIVGTFFQGVVLIIGVLGNIMVVVVVKRTRNMHTSTNCYLVSLAVADCVVLLASVPNEILSYYLVGNQWVWGEVGCAGFVFCQNLGINASSLSLVAFTVERYIAICHPIRAQCECTVSRAKRITTGVWIFAVIYCSPWLGLTTTRPLYYKGYGNVEYCDFKLPRPQYLVYFFTDLVVFYVAPLVLSCVLYGLIARVLFNRKMINTLSTTNGVINHEYSNTARWKVVRMLLVVVIVFATLWLPYRGMLVYNSFATLFNKKRFMDLWFLMFAKTCVYINSAINPFLYNAMSGKFRRAFQCMLRCQRPAITVSNGTRTTSSGLLSSLRKSLKKSSSEDHERRSAPRKKDDINILSLKEPIQGATCRQTEL